MAYNTSILSYPDVTRELDKALESTKGIRLHFPDANALRTFKGRFHTFRTMDRKENAKLYPLDDPMHGRSVYDPLLSRSISDTVLEILKADAVEYNSEEIE